jgi:hypothetical protein
MTVPQAVREEIKKQRKWLDDNELAYRDATSITGDADELKKLLRSLKTQMEPIFMYNPDEQPAHSAVYVVSSMRERFAGLFQDLDFVEDYEGRKKDYIDTVKAYALYEEPDEEETTD